MKKILLVNLFPFEPLLPFFKSKGFQVVIYKSKLKDLRFKRWPFIKYPFLQIWDILSFYFFYNKVKPNIIHINFAYSGIPPMLLGLPYFIECHGSDVRRNLNLPLIGYLTKRAIRKAIKVFYATPDIYQFIKHLRPDAEYLQNTVDTNMFSPSNNNIKSDNMIKVFVSCNITRVKGGREIFNLIEQLVKINPNIQFTIFRPKFLPKSKEKISQFDNKFFCINPNQLYQPYIKQIERVQHDNIPSLINSHDIVIGQFSSLGFLTVTELESMSCGKVVISRINKEYYNEVPPVIMFSKNYRELAKKINSVINSPYQLNKFGMKARKWIIKYHNPEKVSKYYTERILKLIQ